MILSAELKNLQFTGQIYMYKVPVRTYICPPAVIKFKCRNELVVTVTLTATVSGDKWRQAAAAFLHESAKAKDSKYIYFGLSLTEPRLKSSLAVPVSHCRPSPTSHGILTVLSVRDPADEVKVSNCRLFIVTCDTHAPSVTLVTLQSRYTPSTRWHGIIYLQSKRKVVQVSYLFLTEAEK